MSSCLLIYSVVPRRALAQEYSDDEDSDIFFDTYNPELDIAIINKRLEKLESNLKEVSETALSPSIVDIMKRNAFSTFWPLFLLYIYHKYVNNKQVL